MKKGDVITVITVLVISAVLMIIPLISASSDTDFVMIDEEIYNLNDNNVISIEKNGYHLTVIIENGYVFVSDSDCPDSTCRIMGKINRSGQFIACVPAGIYIEIGRSRLDVDNFDSIAG